MSLWTSADAEAATGGRSTAPWVAQGVSIDTRSLAPGDLFVALRAERDGHDFVAQALDRGASAALVSRIPEGLGPDAPLLVVPDVLLALEQLGRAARARTSARVVAVTGSVGKTSTKEMLRAALAPSGKVHAAEASYNNHWGVPLTLARMPADTDFAVIEIGMNHPGEIAPLARQARPHVVIVTTVGAAHLEAFDSVAGIAREKASICEGLEPNGTAILNADLAETPILVAAARAAGAEVVTFGTSEAADRRLTDLRVEPGRTVGRSGDATIAVATEGAHFLVNALAVLAAAQALGADERAARENLAAWSPPQGRGGRARVPWPGGALTLLDDAFNANPTSMAAGLATLAATEAPRRVAILGDMLELGPSEAALHAALAQDPAMGRIAAVHCVGPRMRALHAALPDARRGAWAERPQELSARLPDLLAPGDAVLVKGSKGSKVSLVVDAIRAMGQGASPAAPRG